MQFRVRDNLLASGTVVAGSPRRFEGGSETASIGVLLPLVLIIVSRVQRRGCGMELT